MSLFKDMEYTNRQGAANTSTLL